MNKVTLVGRWTKDVELKFLPGDGKAVAKSILAVDRRFKREGQQEADFLPVVIWGKPAENIANYCGKKGDLISIAGRIETRNYENQNGDKVYVTEIIVEESQFLNFKSNNNRQANNENNTRQQVTYDEEITPIDDGDMPF